MAMVGRIISTSQLFPSRFLLGGSVTPHGTSDGHRCHVREASTEQMRMRGGLKPTGVQRYHFRTGGTQGCPLEIQASMVSPAGESRTC